MGDPQPPFQHEHLLELVGSLELPLKLCSSRRVETSSCSEEAARYAHAYSGQYTHTQACTRRHDRSHTHACTHFPSRSTAGWRRTKSCIMALPRRICSPVNWLLPSQPPPLATQTQTHTHSYKDRWALLLCCSLMVCNSGTVF